jgi:hypothetical protein
MVSQKQNELFLQQYANHHNLDLLRAIHKIGNDAKRLKDINDANKIFFFLVNC